MSRCNQCKIEILDNTQVCPLCNNVLQNVLQKETDEQQWVRRYPDIKDKDRKINIFIRVYIFVCICLEACMVYLNYTFFHGIYWSLITGGAFIYGLITLSYAVFHNAGYRAKGIVQTVFGILFIVLVDVSLGFKGWSLNYVFPSVVMAVDLGIIILMIVNSRNWQSYILFQLFMTIWSLVPILLHQMNIITDPNLSIIALIVSVILFLGTFIIGGRRASTELKRRFHVR